MKPLRPNEVFPLEQVPAPKDLPRLQKWQQNLLNAADYLEEHGWTRGRLRDSHGRVCAIGALLMGTSNSLSLTNLFRPSFHTAINKLRGEIGRHSIIGWNDRSYSEDQVVQAFRRAAEL